MKTNTILLCAILLIAIGFVEIVYACGPIILTALDEAPSITNVLNATKETVYTCWDIIKAIPYMRFW